MLEDQRPINERFAKAAIDKMRPYCGGEPFNGIIGGVRPVCFAHECVKRTF